MFKDAALAVLLNLLLPTFILFYLFTLFIYLFCLKTFTAISPSALRRIEIYLHLFFP
jgi:hypothetical protein